MAPFYRNQLAADRVRLAEMDAAAGASAAPVLDTAMTRFVNAAAFDADALRAFIETVMCVDLPQQVLARPLIQRALERLDGQLAPAVPGPDRDELLRLLAA